jgi:hypothetical protein
LMKPGVGSRYSLESKYGNVYLRKISQWAVNGDW